MSAWLRIPLQFLALGLLGALAFVAVLTGAYYYAEPSLPSADELRDVSRSFAVPSQFFSRDGRLISQYGEQKRSPTNFSNIPRLLVEAVVLDVPSTLRAVFN